MASSIDLFAYLAAFVTITLALALGDMVQSLHRLIRAGAAVRWHVLPLLAALFVFLSVLSEFFSLWQFHDRLRIDYYALVGMVSVATLLAFAALACLPDDVPAGGIDLLAFHLGGRRHLFGVLTLVFAADALRNVLFHWAPGASFAQNVSAFVHTMSLPIVVVLALLAWTARPWLHGLGLVALLAMVNADYAGWRIVVAG
jgi:hypothetical protein